MYWKKTPKGWNIESKFEQIMPSCLLLWNGEKWDNRIVRGVQRTAVVRGNTYG